MRTTRVTTQTFYRLIFIYIHSQGNLKKGQCFSDLIPKLRQSWAEEFHQAELIVDKYPEDIFGIIFAINNHGYPT